MWYNMHATFVILLQTKGDSFLYFFTRVYAQNDKIKGINNGDEEELAVNYCA